MTEPILSFLIVLLFYLNGYALSSLLCPNSSLIHRYGAAFPIGFGTWTLLWISTSLCFQLIGVESNLVYTWWAFGLYLGASLVLTYWLIHGNSINPEGAVKFSLSIVILLGLFMLAYYFRRLDFTGDSYSWGTWTINTNHSLRVGRPLFLLTLSNLSLLIGPDYYLYAIHPLAAVSLLLLMFEAIFYGFEKAKKISFNIIFIVSWATVFVFLSNREVLVNQLFYNNTHFFAAIYILLFFMGIVKYRQWKPHKLYFALILLMFICTRMEAALFVVMFIPLIAYTITDFTEKRKLLALLYVAAAPYLTHLIFITGQENFISDGAYLIILTLLTLVSLFFILVDINKYSILSFFKNRISSVVFALVSFTLLGARLLKPDHMLESLGVFLLNSFNSSWGVSNYFIVAMITLLLGLRWKIKYSSKQYDSLLGYFGASICLMLALTYLRSPLRLGWSDSANRMLLHFLPLAYVWIGFEIRSLVNYFSIDKDYLATVDSSNNEVIEPRHRSSQ